MDNLIYIDDSDPRVYYNEDAGWSTGGHKEEFGSTTHGARGTSGAHALLTFTGTSVVVYGTIPQNTQGNSTYIIDGSTPSTFINPILPATTYQQIFYESPQLENKQHTLTIMPLTDGVFWLDYFVVKEPSAGLASDQILSTTRGPSPAQSNRKSDLPGSSTASGTSTITSTVSMESTSKAAPTSVPPHSSIAAIQPSATPDMQHASPKAIVAGSVTGGVFVLFLIALFVWRGYKRRNAFHSISTTILTPTEPSRIRHAVMHDTRLFHKSPRIAMTSSPPSEASLLQETREFAATSSTTFSLNTDHVGLRPSSLVETPPAYTEHTSSPV